MRIKKKMKGKDTVKQGENKTDHRETWKVKKK